MFAFTAPLFLQSSRPPLCTSPSSRKRPFLPRAALSPSPPDDDDLRVRFNRDPDPSVQPKRTFFPNATPSDALPTPNERILTQVRESMRKLGIDEHHTKAAPPPASTPIDISRVSPLNAFLGAAGSALMSYAAWLMLGYIVTFFATHPLTNEIYIVQRISAVVRTALVCLFALGSGISGVTALGLFLLSARTSVAAVTGEFRDSNNTADSS